VMASDIIPERLKLSSQQPAPCKNFFTRLSFSAHLRGIRGAAIKTPGAETPG
jgi:hypothetical protein